MICSCFQMQLLGVLKLKNAYILPPGWYMYSCHPFNRVFLNTCRKVYIHFFYYFVLRCEFVVVLLWESKKFYWIMWGPHNGDPWGELYLSSFVRVCKRISPYHMVNYGSDMKNLDYTQLDAKIFLLYFSNINRAFIWKSSQFYSFKVLHVSNFTNTKEKIYSLCKNTILRHGKIDFYWSSKIQILQLVGHVNRKN